MDLEQINARLAEIRSLMDDPNANLVALRQEAEQLIEQRNSLRADAENRQALRNMVAGGAGTQVQDLRNLGAAAASEQQDPEQVRNSIAYRNAWLRHIARDAHGNPLLGEMSVEERAAFTLTTANSGAVVPTQIQDRIIELVHESCPMLADATLTDFVRGFGVPRHKSIDQGDAKAVAEGTANDDEQDTFDLLPLDGEEIKKHIELSKKMQIQSLDSFAEWIASNLSKRISAAKERLIIVRLENEEFGIAADNKLPAGALTDALIRSAFAKIKASGIRSVYANSETIWNHIAGVENEKGEKIFVPSSMVDPVVQGRVYGAAVKLDTEVADNVIYIGVGSSILANDFDELEIVPSVEPKTLKRIYTGYSLFDAGLGDPCAFAKLTVQ